MYPPRAASLSLAMKASDSARREKRPGFFGGWKVIVDGAFFWPFTTVLKVFMCLRWRVLTLLTSAEQLYCKTGLVRRPI